MPDQLCYLALIVWAATGVLLSYGRDRALPAHDRALPAHDRALPAQSAEVGASTPANTLVVAAIAAALVTLMAVGIQWMLHGAIAAPFGQRGHVFPILVGDDLGWRDAATSNAELAISSLESACLLALYVTLAGRTVSRATIAVVAVAFAAMLVIAVTSPVTNSSDMYAYAAYAREPLRAYAPGHLHFTGDYSAIDALLRPIPPCVYGPVWLAFSHLALAPFPGLGAGLFALRGIEVGALLACLWALCRIAAPFATIALLALNPAVFGLWIVDGHNDLFGVALLLVAMTARKHRYVQMAFIVTAGLVKLPLVVIGSMLFADEPNVRRRFASVAVVLGSCLLLSYAFAGPAYFRYLASVGARARPLLETALTTTCMALDALALVLALVARRYSPGLSWIWPSLAGYPAGWYAIWGLPYALASGGAATFLIAEPAIAYLFCWNYVVTPPAAVASVLAVVLPIACGVIVANRRRHAANRSHAVVTQDTSATDTTRAWV